MPPRHRVTHDDPPLGPGMARVSLDTRGHLLDIEAPASARARVVAFTTRPLAGAPPPPPRPSGSITAIVLRTGRPALFLAALFIGAWIARRNLRAGRGDARRAVRVAAALMALRVLSWALGAHHTPGSLTSQLGSALAWGLFDFAYGALFYLAIEPYVRRLWPRVLTSWARLLDGRHADPRVGRELLIGILTGTAIALAIASHQTAPALFGAPVGRPDNVGYVENQLATLVGLRWQLAEILDLWRSNIVLTMGFVVILVMARIALRNATAAIVAAGVLFVPLAMPAGEFLALDVAFAVAVLVVLMVLMMRFGLLAATVCLLTHATLQSAPLGLALGAWPTSRTALVLLLLAGAATYGFARSLAGRPVFRDVLP